MEAKAQVLGHPVHQMLIVFPLGVLSAAWVFDMVFWIFRSPAFATLGYWNTAAGMIGGVVAAVFGFIDWSAIPSGTRAKRVGVYHAVINVVVLILFACSWLLRVSVTDHAPTIVSFSLATLAFLLAGASGWLGGELVNRHCIGVKDGAGIDAPGPLIKGGSSQSR